MRSTSFPTRALLHAALSGAVTVSLAGTARAEIAPQISENAGENRLVFSFETLPGMSGTAPVTLGTRVGQQAMVYRIRVRTQTDPTTAPGGSDAWEIGVYSTSTGRAVAEPPRSLALLSPLRPEVTLPRPLGYVLVQSDSVVVVVRITDAESAPTSLVVTVDFEPVNAAFSRLAVLPHSAVGVTTTSAFTGPAPDEARTRAWEWTPSVSGRVVAFIGAQSTDTREIVHSDAETGEVLRRAWPAGRAQPGATPADASIPLISASVQAGRTYRLTVVYGGTAPEASQAGPGLLHVLVIPEVHTR